jgi:DNA invertase Pin-like site-specific DNA recombinase
MIICYSRVSTSNQSTDRQLFGMGDRIGAKSVRWIEDNGVSGSVSFGDRRGGKEVVELVRNGEVTELHIWELSRLGRNLKDVVEMVDFLQHHRTQLIVHKEHLKLLNDDGSTNPIAKMMIGILGSLAEMEREQINARIREGIAIAKIKGKYRGRKRGSVEKAEHFLAKPKSRQIGNLLNEDYPITYIAKVVGCSVNTVYKVKNLRMTTV